MNDRLTASEESRLDGLTEQLKLRFGLDTDPFADAPDRFYGGAQRQHCLETLRHLVAFGDMLLLLTGEKGSGRSRLLAELIQQEKDRLEFRLIPGRAFESPEALARMLWSQTRKPAQPGQSPGQLIAAFLRWSEEQASRGRRWVLLLEDADRMPSESLQALVQAFRQANRSEAAVPVLTGSYQLVQRLVQDEPISSIDWLHQIHLRPLTREEAAELIRRSFEWAGGSAEGVLDPARLDQLETLGQGNIGRIRRIAPGVLLGVMGQQTPPPAPPRPGWLALWPWGLAAILLLALSFGLVSLLHQPNEPEGRMAKQEPPAGTAEDEVRRVREMIRLSSPETGAGETDVWAHLDEAPEVELPALDSVKEGAVQEAPDEDVEPESSGSAGQETALAGDEAGQQPTGAPERPAQTGQVPSSEPSGEAGDVPDSGAPATGEGPEKTGETEAAEAFSPRMPSHFRSREWLESRPASHFTIQLLGSYREETAASFIEDLGKPDQLYYVRSTFRDKPWFVVLYGEYASAAEARAAQDNFPPSLAGREAWVREFGGI